MLAHHYGAALEYASATGMDVGPFADAGPRRLSRGRRSCLRPPRLPPGSRLLRARSRALGRRRTSGAALPTTVAPSPWRTTTAVARRSRSRRERLLAAGNCEARGGGARASSTEALQLPGRRDAAFEHIEKALELVRDAPASPAKARVLTESSRLLALAERSEAAAVAQEASRWPSRARARRAAARARSPTRARDKSLRARLRRRRRRSRAKHRARSLGGLARGGARAPQPRVCELVLGRARTRQPSSSRRRSPADRFGMPPDGDWRAAPCSARDSHDRAIWDEALGTAEDLIAQLESAATTSYFEYHLRRYALAHRARARRRRRARRWRMPSVQSRLVGSGGSAGPDPLLSSWAFIAAELERLDEAACRQRRSLRRSLATRRPSRPSRYSRSLGCGLARLRGSSYGGSRSPRRGYVWREAILAVLDRRLRAAPLDIRRVRTCRRGGTPSCWEASCSRRRTSGRG